jgi:N-acetylglucosaminyldiphosphoundecaprenol N-acetyl-beta-D-mannosaminyltransferase
MEYLMPPVFDRQILRSAVAVDLSERHDFLGVPISCLTLDQTVVAAEQAMHHRKMLQHVCLNVAKFVAMRSNPELDRDVRSSDIVSVDGMGIVWAARALGIGVPERVAGVDIMDGVIALCAAKGYRAYFLGARPDVLVQAMRNAKERFPSLVFAGSRDGYFKTEEEPKIVAAIKSSRPDCLFIGMPTPQKERFLSRYRNSLGVPFIMGVGGSLDILAGRTRRAPLLLQKTGLEWLFRTIQEPVRLGPRYIKTNARFVAIFANALISRWFSGR